MSRREHEIMGKRPRVEGRFVIHTHNTSLPYPSHRKDIPKPMYPNKETAMYSIWHRPFNPFSLPRPLVPPVPRPALRRHSARTGVGGPDEDSSLLPQVETGD